MYQAADIHNVLIAGPGVMGASFAQIFAKYGYQVYLYGVSDSSLEKASYLIGVNQQALVEQGALTAEESAALRSRITMTTSKDCFTKVEFVLESITENMEVKHAFFRDLCAVVSSEVVLATNTSGMSISEIAQAVTAPERFAGMHWINPPYLIPLVEVIAGEHSSGEVLDTICGLALALGKKPVRVHKDPTGFLLNRLQYAVVREAFHCVEMGYATMEDIDDVMKYGLGLRYACIGPFETIDFGGIDIFNKVGSYMFDALCNDSGVPRLLREAYEEGRCGVKNLKGFYDYSGGKDREALARRDAAFLAVSEALYGEKKAGE